MDITYKYTIVSVDDSARCMEVVYEAEGHETLHIGTRLPYVGEKLEDVIKMFAPVPFWVEKVTPVVCPPTGASGIITPAPIVVAPIELQTTPAVIDITPVGLETILEPVTEIASPVFPVTYTG